MNSKQQTVIKNTAEGAGSLKVHWQRGMGKELISAELSVNKHWKGRKADSRQVISHSLKQGR
jgi:hypothetical protein